MTRARATLVSVEETPYYHCTGRCVRRAFLCGYDKADARSYEHRRAWMRARLSLLTEVFAIDVCAYALMSNHYHLVLKLQVGQAKAWSDDEVLQRWTQVFAGPAVVQQSLHGRPLTPAERAQVHACAQTWRARLGDLSWFMRCLNEHIARRANAEDGCTGHFWEGRFKSQALLDDTALLTAMTYVDLNPVRAGLAQRVETSDYTSGQDRLNAVIQADASPAPTLVPFVGTATEAGPDGLPFNLQDYLDLLDTTGRCVMPGKHGAIDSERAKLLEGLGVQPEEWLATVTQLQRRYQLAIGAPGRLQALATRWGKRWLKGMDPARRLYRIQSG